MTFGSELTGREIAIVDANAAALGVTRKQLMESAGNAAAGVIRDVADADDRIEIVAGRGNNGGDALVAARFLGAYDCRVTLLGDPDDIGTDIARENWNALERSTVETRTISDSTAFDLSDPDVIVDAMLGTGISGALREPVATAADAINAADATVVSLDVPSGLDASAGTLAEDAVRPDRIVTFHKSKPGLADLDAPLEVADIGVPPGAEYFVERGDLLRLSRPADSHKGDFGEVLVIGGGPYTGAPALAAQSALRAGADLVRVAVPAAIADEVQGYSEDLIVRPFDGTQLTEPAVDPLLDLATDHDSVVLGPGLGAGEATLSAVEAFLADFEGTAVVDADALRVVPDVETGATLICTPHRGEFERMGGHDAADWETRAENVADLAAELDATLLVKGPADIISDGKSTRVSRTGNPGMTVGGTGDVLAGVTGALAATLDPHPAASLGAYVTGRAGDLVVEERGYGLVASDLLDRVPTAMWDEQP
ncbi:ADP-dependent NAD(P)H-hydrate dehydratase / NAD(P)H-hydrate epimerase [Halorhabdus sp. SVX81]|uniref:NAD(P)H-hydrate dehydratase n=1 Tax=Halorhabdus sp. SVX81 TaxID=2978283 RepID=UPI0023DC657D|nr:NAD(P)H-hydrate dehydratase [Halorhabdus sp. SVX81]WEL16970.1 ADP-dependent NAD(P)H-hydrate dehydratase / NAD(P)H-hydrate epimerase [Halorhabdus sp. SVX81]